MSKRGFIRRSILLWAAVWVFDHVFFTGNRFIQSPSLKWWCKLIFWGGGVWGQITLLQRLRDKPTEK